MIRLTRRQVREVDRRAIQELGIPGIVLMENAARGVADVAMTMLAPGRPEPILILCGGGNNGGDGLAVARLLHNRGLSVRIVLATDPTRYAGDALINWNIVQKMNLPVMQADSQQIAGSRPPLLIDAIFGTGLSQPPRDPFASIVHAVETCGAPVLAIDLPSGLDCDTGQPLGPCIRATRTVTFVAEKIGFASPAALDYTGPITVADIGTPPELVQQIRREIR